MDSRTPQRAAVASLLLTVLTVGLVYYVALLGA